MNTNRALLSLLCLVLLSPISAVGQQAGTTREKLRLKGKVDAILLRENLLIFVSGMTFEEKSIGTWSVEPDQDAGRISKWSGTMAVRGWRIHLKLEGIGKSVTETIYGDALISNEIEAELEDYMILRDINNEVIGISGETLIVNTIRVINKWDGQRGPVQDFAASRGESPELDAILRKFPQGALVKRPFRMRLVAYFGDKNTPANMKFEVETLDIQQPHQRIKLGEFIPQTKWKLEQFTYKTQPNKETNVEEDVSELRILNTEIKYSAALSLGQITMIPIVLGLGRGEPVKQQ